MYTAICQSNDVDSEITRDKVIAPAPLIVERYSTLDEYSNYSANGIRLARDWSLLFGNEARFPHPRIANRGSPGGSS
jgi:hypothetical protein